MYTKLPLNFKVIFIESKISDYINANQAKLLNRTILSNFFTNDDNSFSVHIIFKDIDIHNALFICLLASYKVLDSIQENHNISLQWPNKLVVKNALIGKCEIKTFSDTMAIKISMKKFCNQKDMLIKLCEQLNGQIHELKMLGGKHIMSQIKQIVPIEKKQYTQENKKIRVKIDSIDDHGNLQIVANNYQKHSLFLDNFLCIKEFKS